ncbi:AraC family transcriptional regulator [Marilutibacter spongiae]|uniref:AraC family transcriptional regulator n=1 Tax=Marilutibacter spongiae TaxID=2025720 RepID=A0A7W3TJI9_9GAMM|nr:AraC family transcriptional regulator [Lysobacter spongiae]MBB1059485.1 AraC family transcriptional regulator [Lysobacter spongiae]
MQLQTGHADAAGSGEDPRQRELAARIARLATADGAHPSPWAPLTLIRASAPNQGLPSVYEPSLCVVVQGRKRTVVGDQVLHYDPLNYLVVSLTLPAVGQILEATPEHPYLCLRLAIDTDEIARLLLELGPPASPSTGRDDALGMYVASMSGELLDALLRLVRLLDSPRDLPVLAPAASREIQYRVLMGELGHQLRHLAVQEGRTHRVARAIDWIRGHYDQALRVDALAEALHMSASSLHHQFKAVTAMSPLQFQKQLRLHEARRLMFSEGLEAAAAGHRVGYESPSQFSREYRRLFGAPPRREVRAIHGSAAGMA